MEIECKACNGDGFITADSDTPQNERVTRDSRCCPYCRGSGRIPDRVARAQGGR